MSIFDNSDTQQKEILANTKIIAVVGLSPNMLKPSHAVASYMQKCGYKIVPIYPKGRIILGEKVYRNLKDIPFAVDLVNVFRRGEHTLEIVKDAVRIKAKYVWLQEGISNATSKKCALHYGLGYIEDKCIKVAYNRLFV